MRLPKRLESNLTSVSTKRDRKQNKLNDNYKTLYLLRIFLQSELKIR